MFCDFLATEKNFTDHNLTLINNTDQTHSYKYRKYIHKNV